MECFFKKKGKYGSFGQNMFSSLMCLLKNRTSRSCFSVTFGELNVNDELWYAQSSTLGMIWSLLFD